MRLPFARLAAGVTPALVRALPTILADAVTTRRAARSGTSGTHQRE